MLPKAARLTTYVMLCNLCVPVPSKMKPGVPP